MLIVSQIFENVSESNLKENPRPFMSDFKIFWLERSKAVSSGIFSFISTSSKSLESSSFFSFSEIV
jgi:hypothetical protein